MPPSLGLATVTAALVLAALGGAVLGRRLTRRATERRAALECRRLERQALESSARAAWGESLVEALGIVSDEALLRLDAEQLVRWANPVAQELWPCDKEKPLSLTATLGSGAVAPLLAQLPEGEALAEGLELRDRRYRVTALRLAHGGFLLALRDVTQQERLARARRDMLANISHDLRTPLTSIGMLLEGLKPGAAAPPALLYTLRQQVEVLRKLAEDLVQLDRLESGRTPLRLASLPLAGLLAEIRAGALPLLEAAGLSLELDLPAHLSVLADADQLRRVLVNLLDNAVQASAPGGRIRISAAADGVDTVQIAVSDEGSGIPPQDLERIFERFYRGDRARGQSGSGLGLAIVRHIVEGHGGRVSAANNAGRGATVRFNLPLG